MGFSLPNQLVNTQAGVESTRQLIRTPDGSDVEINELRDSFRQGFVFEIQNIETGQNIPGGVFVTVLNPVRYNLSEPFQATLTPTENNSVDAEENGVIIREIVLEGTFGIKEKRARGFTGGQGNGEAISGNQHFNLFRNFFRKYSEIKKDPNEGAKHRMIFHALRDDDHFVVVPKTFETPRDASRTRTHYEYRVTLSAIDTAITPINLLGPEEREFNFTNALRDINEAFNDARAGVAEVTANISAIKRRVGNIQATLTNAAQVINAVGAFLSGTAQLINFPLQSVATVTESLGNAADRLIEGVSDATFGVLAENARSIRRIEAAIDVIAMYDEKFQDIVTNTENVFKGENRATRQDISAGSSSSAPGTAGSGGTTIGSRVRSVSGSSGRLAGLTVPRRGGLREVVVRRTDSLESIATANRTTAAAIILLNDLRSPYLTEFGGPGILKPGDRVLVPVEGTDQASTGRGITDFLDSEEALYGIDIALDDTVLNNTGLFDIAVTETQDSMDFAIRKGVPNVVQGTEITLNTERGTTQFLPDIGIRRNIGTKGTTQHVLLASIILREGLLSDTRINGIQSSRAVFDSVTGSLELEITPIVSGQQPGTTFVVPFGKASGES